MFQYRNPSYELRNQYFNTFRSRCLQLDTYRMYWDVVGV